MSNPFSAKPNVPRAGSGDAPPQKIPEIPHGRVKKTVSVRSEGRAEPPVTALRRNPEVQSKPLASPEASPALEASKETMPFEEVLSRTEPIHGKAAPQTSEIPQAPSAPASPIAAEVPQQDAHSPVAEEGVSQPSAPPLEAEPKSTQKVKAEVVNHPPAVSHHSEPPPLGMDEVSCRTCRYFESKGESRCIVREGECRRKAPSPSKNRNAHWPVVPWQSWCGEWELGISDEEMVRMARVVADRMNDNVRESFSSHTEE